MQYKRGIYNKILETSRHFPALLLTGARQTGKTTLLKEAFPNHRYISLDLPSDAELAENDPEEFFRRYPPPLFIDEVQYAPKVFRHLKRIIDQDRHTPAQFILTGSQKFPLMKGISESLTGRCVWLELETLSSHETNFDYKDPLSKIRTLITGGFPDLWRDPLIPKRDYFRTYLATYIERDLRQILNITNLRDFERFIRAAAARNGQLLNKADLAKDVGVTAKTISDWISVLEASNQIVLLEPYFTNIGKRIIKSPKLYFNDTGFLCYLLGIQEENFESSPFTGSLWETFIFSELRKYLSWSNLEQSLYFYRDQEGREIDFLLYAAGKVHLIEAKWTETPNAKDARSMNELREIILNKKRRDLTIQSQWVVCRMPTDYPLSSTTQAISGFKLFDLLN